MINLGVVGAAGRMGQALVRCAREVGGVRIVAAVEQPGHSAVGEDAGIGAGLGEIGVVITADLGALAQADVLIDFTSHVAAPINAKLAADLARAFVLGTTGLTDDESAAVRKAAERVPVVWAPNMSLGVNLLFAAVRKAAEVFGMEYRVEIDETHHVHKKDAPSGTALRLGEKVAEGRGQDFRRVMVHDAEQAVRAHPASAIVIRSHREGEAVGDHVVSFANEGETIEFAHHAWSRDAFALGAIRASQWVVSRKPGLYDMQDVLGL